MATADDIAAWDAEAEAFDGPADHGLRDPAVRAAWRELLLARMPPAPAHVADLGSGTGTLSVLLGEAGYTVDGVDFSPRMVEEAQRKAAGSRGVRFIQADAFDPPLAKASYDVVLCRHVLWAMPDPAVALARWLRLLKATGRIVLVEGRWSTGGGLSAEQTVDLLERAGRTASLTRLGDPVYWGRTVTDDRYVVSSVASSVAGSVAGR